VRVRQSLLEGGEGSQQAALGFEAVSTAARKRKAEDSVNDKLTAMAATVERLMTAQKEMAESQKALLESNKAILDRNKEVMETIKTQGEISKALRALTYSTSQRTYGEVTANSGTRVGSQTSQTRSTSAGSSQVRKEKPQVQDERAVSINMGRSQMGITVVEADEVCNRKH
jgi:seryl-tRNA synthetase